MTKTLAGIGTTPDHTIAVLCTSSSQKYPNITDPWISNDAAKLSGHLLPRLAAPALEAFQTLAQHLQRGQTFEVASTLVAAANFGSGTDPLIERLTSSLPASIRKRLGSMTFSEEKSVVAAPSITASARSLAAAATSNPTNYRVLPRSPLPRSP